MRREHVLQLIGIAIFLIATTLTYGIVIPVQKNVTSLEAITDKITNTTENTTTNTTATPIDDTSRFANDYRIMTAIAAGFVIAIVIVFLLGFW
jgi:tetrahydromethanopterin S-methyltransferase subunit B